MLIEFIAKRFSGLMKIPMPAMAWSVRVFLLFQIALSAMSAHAADIAFSGFGTIGYAVSDQSYAYQRFIDDRGTFSRDSVFALQMDAAITPRWSATAQLKLSPSINSDTRWASTLAWGFVSWRPSNDWLFRAGKLRIPLYLNSENLDVGASFDYARLPIEMYSMAPTSDFNGVSFVKFWDLNDGELSLDGYWGKTRTKWRTYFREEVPGYIVQGAASDATDITAQGLALTYREDGNTYRLGVHKATAIRGDGEDWVVRPVLLNPAPGVAYYSALPGPGIPERHTTDIYIANASLDIGLGHNVRLAAEYAVRKPAGIERGIDSSGGYLSLRRKIDKWTPYVYYARLQSDKRAINTYNAVNGTTVPAMVPYSAIINGSQRATADALLVFDQSSWAVGTSYALTPTSKLKAEWMQTRIGAGSSLVDAPSGSDIRNQNINVLSLSYSFAF